MKYPHSHLFKPMASTSHHYPFTVPLSTQAFLSTEQSVVTTAAPSTVVVSCEPVIPDIGEGLCGQTQNDTSPLFSDVPSANEKIKNKRELCMLGHPCVRESKQSGWSSERRRVWWILHQNDSHRVVQQKSLSNYRIPSRLSWGLIPFCGQSIGPALLTSTQTDLWYAQFSLKTLGRKWASLSCRIVLSFVNYDDGHLDSEAETLQSIGNFQSM